MSVVVRMEIPSNCAKCDLHYRCSESRGFHGFDAIREMMRLDTVNDKREDEHCLFVCSLPKEHGDLIDRDELLKESYPDDEYDAHIIYADDICKARAVVPAEAERRETEQV